MEQKETQVKILEQKMEQSDFWDDNVSAQKVISECNELRSWTQPYYELKRRFEDVQSLIPEAYDADDQDLVDELLAELDAVEKGISDLEIRKMLSGELDSKSCFLSINAGAGGTEACDWVLMLSRMYRRWAERRSWKVEEVDVLPGEVAGIKSITLKFSGPFAYGYSKAEKGVHRLVRISPFDSNSRRHTSFASVDVSPEITDDIDIEVRPDDIRIDTYRASGAGGQHVNKTESAVRITHIPSGIVVACQAERSQLQNKETCFKMLKSKLYEKEVMEREAEIRKLSGDKRKIEWGSQIRSYVFQPYTMVKDTRTNHEQTNINAVMDGDLDPFVNAYLKEFG
ncbi:MAG: Peptide chain release factor 2 [Chlamydiae bacterium]|nr:Peptide chain release factor 2 [Chlamydiota bacterium]